ncbi:hypothetical protein LPTSP4_18760 [Leptospira ryugenii]|uniref:YCII-related domain-containing protein n=1 Tax=Leptospira ryugenii TaxID=1917863 RepID=A0A2P2E0F1_9LEPT|nr:YciI family protein [Leptospira ryugenii]GBF50351.1 hypothetical protein LPTSP4_18760 [Leptospira ryugenii]
MKEFILLFRNIVGENDYSVSLEEREKTMSHWTNWIREIVESGKFVATQPLDYEGAVLRPGSVSDGPYVEAKEILAGYLVCKTANIEDAIEIGKKCPILNYPNGSLEVRPITPFSP